MKPSFRTLPAILAFACASLWAAPDGFIRVGEQRRSELRDAVEAHRAAQHEEMRREEAAAGRRLTPAELAELRQQVRGQWTPRGDVSLHSAESNPAERGAPSPVLTNFGAQTAPALSQRP